MGPFHPRVIWLGLVCTLMAAAAAIAANGSVPGAMVGGLVLGICLDIALENPHRKGSPVTVSVVVAFFTLLAIFINMLLAAIR